MLQAPLAITYGNGLSISLEPQQPLRLSTMAWDFPERPDLIALISIGDRLDFLRDHLKSLCGIWDKLPRLFLDGYFRDIRECIATHHPALDALAAGHGGLFRPEDCSLSAFSPLTQARLRAAPETPDDFAFCTGAESHAVCITTPSSQDRAHREGRAQLRKSVIPG